MLKSYKKTVDHNRKSGNDRKVCSYYEELDKLLCDKPNITPEYTISSSGFGDTKKRKIAETDMSDSDAESNISGAETEDKDPDDKNKKQVKKRRKRSYVPSAVQASNSILLSLQAYEQKKEEREKAKEVKVQERHEQKMSLLEKLIDKF